jgi:hypothetical protein
MGPSVTLCRLDNGFSIVGYTSASWSSKNEFVDDLSAMLLNLTSKCSFHCKDSERAIYCHKGTGPTFGNSELKIVAPFNGKGNCVSFANHYCYEIPASKDGINQLTGANIDGDDRSVSTIIELEVWQIIYTQ